MKSDIKNFPEFINSIKSDDLVYLFGTGISASLTGKSYSWWKWIIDGIHCMKDTSIASAYENSLKNDSSTANMIDIVGKVLKETKADGTYSSWMTTAFETNPITNFKLANTLKKLLITQDVIATTNYDLLLEQATGLSPLSYEEPNIAFSMLDCHVSTHILHIHGVYDSAHGKDNIVADEAQYNSVMENQGAQFIQGILGTRTLIFVGCGKTTEDANISRFIKFANEQLKMDCTYFFLYNSKNPVEGLPSNILPIPYGDEYADLSEFLEDMAQIRIKSKVESNPIIGRTAYQEKVTLSDPLLKYHYSQQSIPFCGRRKELSQLIEFVNSLEDFVWWSITGQAGAGKSRLALEFLKKLPVSWFGFFINDVATAKDIEHFVPFSHTVIVIDYVAGRERFVAELMRKMASKFATGHYRLRILLLERDNLRVSGSWYAILLQRFGKYDTVKTNEYKDSFLNLSDLDENAVDQFIGSVCAVSGLPDDRGRNSSLRKAYGQKFEQLQFRPLFVQLFVEAWIDNDFTLPRYDKFEDILENFMQREQERWLATLDGDYATCNAFIHLLLRANITGKLNVKEIPDFYKEDWDVVSKYIARHSFPGKQRTQTQHTLINSICQNINESNEMIAPLFPDIIKEYMFCFYMEEERLPSMMNEIWRNAAHDFSVFITRCMTDFPENDFYKRAMNAYENSTSEIDVLNGRLELLKKWVINEDDDPYVLLDIISNEYEFWKSVIVPEDSSDKSDIIALLKVSGLNMVASQYGGWSLYDVSDMVAVAEEALVVKGGAATEFMKQFFLQQHITELSKAGFTDAAAYLRGKMEDLISDNPDEDWNSMLRMQNMNAEMMEYLLHDNIQSAYKTLKKMSEKCKYSCVETVRLLAHSCFNFENFAFMLHQEKFLGRGLEIAQKVELLYPDDWTIRARILGCKGSVLQFRYLGAPSISKQELKEELIKLKIVLDTMSFINEESDEALGMTWGILNTLWINVVEGEQTELRMLIDKTDEILKINPYVEEVVTTKIIAIRALHKNILHTKVSHSEVEELFKYVELNFGSGSIRNEFFEMLSESEDADQRENYMTKWVMYGARQDAKYNPIMGSGIDEIDTEEEIYRYLFEFQPQEPYRREHRKIGANEPCPCGSGKKFKKCCRGKGIYD